MLESKLGITDSAELARIEEKISKQKAVEMFESEYFKRKFSRALTKCPSPHLMKLSFF